MYKKMNNHQHIILIILRFLLPFALWGLIFSFFPGILFWSKDWKFFFENNLMIVIFSIISFALMIPIGLIEDLTLKRFSILKTIYKNGNNPDMKKIYWKYIIFSTFLIVPILSVLIEFYYKSKEAEILEFAKNYQELVNKQHVKIVGLYKWQLILISFIIPLFAMFALTIVFPNLLKWNKQAFYLGENINAGFFIINTIALILLFVGYFYFELSILKRSLVFKQAAKQSKKVARKYFIWKLLHILLIVPLFSITPEIYYQMNKHQIEGLVFEQESENNQDSN